MFFANLKRSILKHRFKDFSVSLCRIIHVKPNKFNIQETIEHKDYKIESSIEITKNFPYYYENGLQYVYPYNYNFESFCKARWHGKRIVDIFNDEFALYSREEFVKRISDGFVKVNGKKVMTNYILKKSDKISSFTHRHELAVLATSIDVIYEDDAFLVVNKPPSIPVHPCGLYNRNTVIHIFDYQHQKQGLHVAHRLDKLTSGVLIFTKTGSKCQEFQEQIHSRNVTKEYVCRVIGNFPDSQIICDKPIKKCGGKISVSLVDSHGKASITEFLKLSYNGNSSVVLCKPYTGRTHQIRVHLQYLGHPIVNDPLYNHEAFGPDRGKNGFLHKSADQLLLDLYENLISDIWDEKPCELSEMNKYLISEYSSKLRTEFKNKKDLSRITFNKNCPFCKKNRYPKQTHFGMFLHAFRYKGNNWEFKTDMPGWAFENFSIA